MILLLLLRLLLLLQLRMKLELWASTRSKEWVLYKVLTVQEKLTVSSEATINGGYGSYIVFVQELA